MPRPDTLPTIVPRKIPRQARSAETVSSIVEAAARILESKGGSGYTTNAVAALAGVSPGSLYQYFPNKAALTKALIVRETSALLDELGKARHLENGVEALNAFIRAAVRHQMQRPALARLLDFEEAAMPFDQDLEAVARRAEAIVVDMLGRPDIPIQADVRIAALDVIAMVKGMADAAGARSERGGPQLETRIARAVIGYLWNPLLALTAASARK